MDQYVEQRDGGYYVAGTRVGLDSVVYRFKEGDTPEQILHSFSALRSLEVVNRAIAFYLANKEAVEEYLRDLERSWQQFVAEQEKHDDPLRTKLRRLNEERLLRQA